MKQQKEHFMHAWIKIPSAMALSAGLCAAGLSAAQQHDVRQKPAGVAKAQNQKAGGTVAPVAVVVLPIPVYEVSPGDIAAHPERYYGSVVSVTSDVEDVLGTNMFTLDDHRLAPGPDVVVMTPRPIPVKKGEKVHVIGHLRPLVQAALQRDYNWFRLNWLREAEVKIKLQEKPLIVAASVTNEEGKELLPEIK
jgi:hypothetical protein